MRTFKLITATTLTALALTACGGTEASQDETHAQTSVAVDNTARDRLEAQGIVYSTTDWETTVDGICDTDTPGVYMGIQSEIRKHQSNLTQDEKMDIVLNSTKGGAAPNADILTDREKRMVIDVITDDGCDTPTETSTPELDPELKAYVEIRDAGIEGVHLGNIDVYVDTICEAVEDGIITVDRERGLQLHNPEWTDEEVRMINGTITNVAC